MVISITGHSISHWLRHPGFPTQLGLGVAIQLNSVKIPVRAIDIICIIILCIIYCISFDKYRYSHYATGDIKSVSVIMVQRSARNQ